MNPHVVETGDSEKKERFELTDLVGRRIQRRKKNQSLDTSVGCKMELFNFNQRNLRSENLFMLNSAKHEIFSANKYENANCWKCQQQLAFSYSLAEKFSCSAMFSKKEFAIISKFKFISMTNLNAQLSWAWKNI